MEPNFLLFNLYNKKTIVEIENQATSNFNISIEELTKKAVKASIDVLLEDFLNAKKIIIFCGIGKNATDGLMIGKELKALGKTVQIIKASNWESNIPIEADLIIDALFGIGINRDLVGVWQQIVDSINKSNIPVLSIDIPSGIDPDTGKILGTAVIATLTVTFIGLKPGLFTGKAKNHCGKIKFNNLGLPNEAYNNAPVDSIRLTKKDFKNLLKPREPAAHKGNFGKLLIMGGQDGMVGATLLAGKAAFRAGAGIVQVLTNSKQPVAVGDYLEIQAQNFHSSSQLESLIEKSTVLLLGSGMGLEHAANSFLEHSINCSLPLIVDADGLNLLAENLDEDFEPRQNWILTPHPKEAARLLNTDVDTIENNRFAAIEQLVTKFKATVVLKGAGTLIKEYQENTISPTYVCDLGNPGMATAGMGDVLAGVIAGLVAQKLSLKDACILGVFAHALAGDIVAKDGEKGILASDLLFFIKKIINTICL
jgi:ADP-dependent NAD(P)H-hydrate dehydratase / NAD(P)H-hydrate epimerase